MNLMGNKQIGYFYVMASAILFSLAGILIKLITWSSFTINGIRNLFAFLIMGIYLKSIRHRIKINKVVLLGVVFNFFMNLTFVMATKLTTAANAIVLQFTAPIFVIIFAAVLLKQKPDRKSILTCAFVFGGIVCFFFDKLSADGQIGNIVAIVSGALYAYIFLIKKMKNADFESSVLISQILSFLIFIPAYLKETDFSGSNFIMIAILGIFQLGLAYVFLAKGLDRVPPVAASLTSTIEPILNPIWVALFYGERISLLSAVGAVIVILTSTIYNVFNIKVSGK